MKRLSSTPPSLTPLTDVEALELEALEARIEPHLTELLASVHDLFPAAVIGEMKESLLSFAVTHPTMTRMLKRVGPAPVVEESGTLSSGAAIERPDAIGAKRTSGSK